MPFAGPSTTYDATDLTLNHGTIFRVRDIDEVVSWRNLNSAEFYKFLDTLRRGSSAMQARVEWGERDKAPNFVVVKADAASGATSIDVFDAYQCVAGDVLRNNRTNEIIRLDAIDDADTVSTAATTGYGRAHMGSTAAAMVIGDRLIKMGTQLAEEGTAADSRVITPEALWNYIQMFQKTWQVTSLQDNSQMLDGVGQINELWMRSLWEYEEEINAALWFSRRNRVVAADGNLYSMNGFDQQVKTHVFDFSNLVIPSWEVLNEALSPMYDANSSSGEKMAFVGQGAYTSLLNAARSIGIKEEHYESLTHSDVTVINVDGGVLHVVKDYKTFRGPILSGSGRIVDPANVEMRVMNGHDRTIYSNVQANDQPTIRKDMAMQGMTLVVKHEDSCGRFSGLSTMFDDMR